MRGGGGEKRNERRTKKIEIIEVEVERVVVSLSPHSSRFFASISKINKMTSAPPSSSSGLDLVDLRFAYGGSASNGPLLLDGFNLTLPPGARCLLVGANGAGEFFPPFIS